MPNLTIADRGQVLAIYRESHALWGVGLTAGAYVELWDRIGATPWARAHSCTCAWVDDDGRLLSCLKLYHPQLRVLGRSARCSVLGAIFTPAALRRRGHAAALVRSVLGLAKGRGDPLALLFSDIGRPYYAALGFRTLPAEEHWAGLPRRVHGLDGWSARPMGAADVPLVRRAWAESAERRAIATERDDAHWDLLDVRTEAYFAHLCDPELRPACTVGLCHGEFVGYVSSVGGHGEWHVREVAARGGDPDAGASVLCVAAGHARAAGLRRFYGWLPPDVAERLAPTWKVRSRPRRRAVPMVCALDPSLDLTPLSVPENAYFSYQDQF